MIQRACVNKSNVIEVRIEVIIGKVFQNERCTLTAKRQGVDRGTNSTGGCLFDLYKHGDPVSAFRACTRVFSDG
jgi:uncharacterized Fe-S radical SAM superfamily protein PflX